MEQGLLAAQDRIEAAAREFDRLNPHIMEEMIDVCLRLKNRSGRQHWSVNAAFEVVRYNASVSTNGRTYKLNNNHRSWYARQIMAREPELAGFFEVRRESRVAQTYDE